MRAFARAIILRPRYTATLLTRISAALPRAPTRMASAIGSPPPSAVVADELDPSRFRKVTPVAALRVPLKAVDAIMKFARHAGYILDVPRVRPCVKDAASTTHRLVLLNPAKVAADASVLPEDLRAEAASVSAELCSHALETGFEHLTAEEVLRQIVPAAVTSELPSSFETVGHLAHLNLRDELLPYRHSIGRVLLAKNPALRTVVNKTGTIETQFRTFPMEVIAGDNDTVVEVRHCGATFRFDFRAVYWNSRLQHEHELLVTEHIPAGSTVADVFCGVGPFAVPLALDPRACVVHANDLNPASHAALLANVAANRVGGRVRCYNVDGRAFLRALVAARVPFTHAVMNLPADALSFLDAFVGLYAEGAAGGGRGAGAPAEGVRAGVKRRREEGGGAEGESATGPAPDEAAAAASASSTGEASAGLPPPLEARLPLPLPRIHVYCFSRAEEPAEWTADVAQRAATALGLWPPPEAGAAAEAGPGSAVGPVTAASLLPGLLVRRVRDVAPKKLMLCVSFDLPPAAAYAAARG